MSLLVNYWKGFKRRWHIQSDWQVGIILIVFAITGSTTVYVNKLIYDWLGLTDESSFWIKTVLFLVLMLPIYNVLLLFFGTLLGQYRFFRFFIIKFFSNLIRPFRLRRVRPVKDQEGVSS